mgnify:CR=1 FL=1
MFQDKTWIKMPKWTIFEISNIISLETLAFMFLLLRLFDEIWQYVIDLLENLGFCLQTKLPWNPKIPLLPPLRWHTCNFTMNSITRQFTKKFLHLKSSAVMLQRKQTQKCYLTMKSVTQHICSKFFHFKLHFNADPKYLLT